MIVLVQIYVYIFMHYIIWEMSKSFQRFSHLNIQGLAELVAAARLGVRGGTMQLRLVLMVGRYSKHIPNLQTSQEIPTFQNLPKMDVWSYSFKKF